MGILFLITVLNVEVDSSFSVWSPDLKVLCSSHFYTLSFIKNSHMHIKINQFQANVCFLSPGTSKTQRFSHVSRVYRNGALAWNEFITTVLQKFCRVLTGWWFHIKIFQIFLPIYCLALYRHRLQHLKLNVKG